MPLFFKMEKKEKETHQQKKSARQKTLESYHYNIKNASGRKAKKMARNKLKKYLGK